MRNAIMRVFPRETLIKSFMSRIAGKIAMLARSTTKVAAVTRYWRSQPIAGAAADSHSRTRRFAHRVMAVAETTMPRSATPRVRDFAATRMGTDFAGGLPRCAAAATRYCVAADCGSSRRQPFPRQTAMPLRIRAAHEGDQPFIASHALHPIPQNQVCDHAGLNQRFLSLFFATLFLMASMEVQAGLREGIDAYEKGNYPVALKEFKPLADKGDARAQALIGEMYGSGKGLPQDHKEAASWYHKAAEQGDAGAQTSLGVMYERGIGVPHDDKEAASWYHKAAEQGDAEAQFILGGKYENGQGVSVDMVQAHKWFNLSMTGGFEIARQNMEEIEAKMSREQIEKAQSMAKEWLAKHK